MITDLTFEGFIIKVGKSTDENDMIVKQAGNTDLWFHLANLPSCHTVVSVIRNRKDVTFNKQLIKYCANLTKLNTKYKNLRKVKVIYTEIRNVKLTDVAGKVVLKGCVKTVTV